MVCSGLVHHERNNCLQCLQLLCPCDDFAGGLLGRVVRAFLACVCMYVHVRLQSAMHDSQCWLLVAIAKLAVAVHAYVYWAG